MGSIIGIVVGILTAITLMLGLIGLGVRYALLPWLKDQLVNPVQETHKQLTVNSFKSQEPTLLDRLDVMDSRMKRMEDRITGIEDKMP